MPGDIGRPVGHVQDLGVERASQAVRSEQVHATVAHEGRTGRHRIQGPLEARRCVSVRPEASTSRSGGRSGGGGEVEEVGSFGVIELQRHGEAVENLRGDTADCATFDAGVVLDAHSGQDGDLAAP